MCVHDECTVVNGDGTRKVVDKFHFCEKADRRHGKMCSRVKKTRSGYNSQAPSTLSLDGGSSPASDGPFTPPTAGSSGYRTETRRPSGARRPSAYETRAIKPEIIISIGGKSYPRLSLKSPKRTSYGSVNSNEPALDSPASDTVRTGFPEGVVPPPAGTFSHPQSYNTRDAVPQERRHPPASPYASELDPPSRRRPSHNTLTLHQSAEPSSPTASRVPTLSSSYTTSSSRSNYRTTTVTPQRSHINRGVDGSTHLGYEDLIEPQSSTASSAASGRSAAPETTDRAAARGLQRRESKKQQEHHRNKEEEEEKKQVRFELDRAKSREEQRAEQKYARSLEDRAKARQEVREQKRQQDREPEKKATRKPEREKTKPPTKDFNLPKTATARPRRNSNMSQSDMETRDRLLREERAQMSRERVTADRLEYEEQLAQAQRPNYNPRVNSDHTPTIANTGAPVRRPSVSIVQPAPPNTYATRPSSSSSRNPPPLSYPYASSNTMTRPVSSHRKSSYGEVDNPFALPSTRPIHPNYTVTAPPDPYNPFNPQSPIIQHPPREHDPWDARQMHASLPVVQPTPGFTPLPRNTMHAQGEQIINRSGDRHAHNRARQATGRMEQAIYTSEEEDSGSSGGLYEQNVGVRVKDRSRKQKGSGEGKGRRRL